MFITFEGIDFSGKSTQVELLKKYFDNLNKPNKIIREPGGTEISEIIRKILLDKAHIKMSDETEIFLFSASRAQLVKEVIKPFLEKGYFVISDRFHDSTTAYQGYGRGIPVELVNYVNKLAIGKIIPDITFFIDIPAEEAEKRKLKKMKKELDRIEVADLDFFKRVRNGYLKIASNEKRFKVIDGMLSIEEIHKQILKNITLLETKENL